MNTLRHPKAYVITFYDYGEYSVHGVFTTEAKAQHALDNPDEYGLPPDCGIEECPLDRPRDRRPLFRVDVDSNGEEVYRRTDEDVEPFSYGEGLFESTTEGLRNCAWGWSYKSFENALKHARKAMDA